MTMPVDPGQQDTQRNVDVNLRSNVDQYVTGMNQAEVATNRAASAVNLLDQKVTNLGKRIQSGLLHFAERDFAALATASAVAATYDKQLGTLNATAAITGSRFAGIRGAVEGAFTSLPVSRTSIIQLIETLNDLGVTGAKQLGQLAQTFIKLGRATGEGPNELAQGLVQLSRLMGTTDAGRIEQYSNSLLTVSKNAGVSATGVLSFAQAIAPMARQAGIGQASVLGISAAFSKAGADGYVAANTFNSMVSDITKLTQTGSPDLAKYANLIGVTTKQFRSMDKTTALTQIFETINKQGPDAINTLNRLGIDGVRAQSAISAVVQSGDLRDQIAKAQGSSGDTKNLNKAADASMNTLADALARLRNEATQFGTQIGETFQGPLKWAVNRLADLLHILTELSKPFAPLLAFFGALAAAVAGVAGAVAGLSHIVLAGGLVAMLARSGPAKALREGLAVGRGGPLAGNASAEMYAGGQMPMRAKIPYLFGRGAGEALGPRGEPGAGAGGLRQAARMAVRTPGLIVGGVFRSQRRFLADAGERDPYKRSAYTGTPGAMAPGRAPFSSAGVAEENVARKGAIASMREWTRSQMAANKASTQNEGTVRAFGKTMVDATREVAKFGLQTAKTGASLVTGGRIGGGRINAAGEAGEAGALTRFGRGAKNLATGIGPLGWGLIAASVAPSLIGTMTKPDANLKVTDTNSISKYDQLLGQTSTNLAKFATAVDGAATKLHQVGGLTLEQVGKVTPADRSTAGSGYKVTDDNFTRLSKAAPKDTKAAVGYIQGLAVQHGGMDPQYLDAIKDDLISSYGPKQAQKVLDSYLATSPGGPQAQIDYKHLGQTAKGAGSDGNKISDQAISSIRSQSQVASGKTSSRAELGSLLTYLTGTISSPGKYGESQERGVTHARALLAKLVGGNSNDYVAPGPDGAKGLAGAGEHGQLGRYRSEFGTETAILESLQLTKGGRGLLSAAGVDSSLLKGKDPQALQRAITQLTATQFPDQQQSEEAGRVSRTNQVGAYAEKSTGIQAAVAHPADVNAQYSAQQEMYKQAGGGTQSFDRVSRAFDELTHTIGDATDQLYILSRAAKAYAQQQEQYALPFMSRGQQFGQVSKDYQQAQKTQATAPSPDSAGDLQAAQGAYQQQLQAETQYELQVYQQVRAFHVQMQRSEQDYYRSRARSQRDFQIQQKQGEEDYEIGRERSLRDHSRQLSQQAMTSAQTILNPYQRTQPVPTNGAGTLSFNLGDENDRLRRQRKELDALKKAGLSEQAIQVLDLANPNNAQQLDRLMMDVRDDPGMITRFNAQVATRVKLTKRLTQSKDNLGFAQSQENFKLGLSDAAKDFERQRNRAVEGQRRALGDMEQDYGRMVQRAGEDLTTSMTQLYGSFADNYGKTLAAINKDIGKYAPELAKTLTRELKQVRHAIDATVAAGVPADPGTATTADAGRATGAGTGGGSTGRKMAHAMGVISTQEHAATISEGNRPEMVLPLDARGQQFMAGMYSGITNHLVKTLAARGYGTMPTGVGGGGGGGGGGTTQIVDSSTNFTGPISIEAHDLDAMRRQLEARARIARLSNPRGR